MDTLKMYREEDRLKTFKDYPLQFLNVKKLAKSGCYNLGGYKGVQCYFCKIIIRRWHPDDDEVERHLKKSPKCALLTNRKTYNLPLNIEEFNEIILSIPCYMDIDE